VSGHPTPDAAAARTLGRALRNAGYSEDAIYDLLGEDAYSVDRDDAQVEARRLPQTPLATVIRVVFLQLSVERADAVRALGPRGVEALAATGLAEVGDQVTPRSRILPVGKVLLASDGFSLDADDPADYVATYTPTAQVLDSLTPRAQIERALDVGTGSGIHALLAAQHARHVVATDVNEPQRRPQRPRQHRGSPWQPVRAGCGRVFRPHHLQRAVRGLARAPLGVP
jgi:hypothetical protein